MNLTFMDLHLLAGADYVKSIEFRVTQKNFKNLGSPSMAESAICPMGKLELSV